MGWGWGGGGGEMNRRVKWDERFEGPWSGPRIIVPLPVNHFNALISAILFIVIFFFLQFKLSSHEFGATCVRVVNEKVNKCGYRNWQSIFKINQALCSLVERDITNISPFTDDCLIVCCLYDSIMSYSFHDYCT